MQGPRDHCVQGRMAVVMPKAATSEWRSALVVCMGAPMGGRRTRKFLSVNEDFVGPPLNKEEEVGGQNLRN